jgi:hypothetical protein
LAAKDSFLQIRHLSSCFLDQTELKVIHDTVEMETPGGAMDSSISMNAKHVGLNLHGDQ